MTLPKMTKAPKAPPRPKPDPMVEIRATNRQLDRFRDDYHRDRLSIAQNLRTLARAVAGHTRAKRRSESRDLEAILEPGQLHTVSSSVGHFQKPPTGMSTLDRLRSDTSISTSWGEAGSVVDPGSGLVVHEGNTDPTQGPVGPQAFLRSAWNRLIQNGDFHDPPPDPDSPIDNTTNPFPGWSVVCTGATAAGWTDSLSLSGSGAHVEILGIGTATFSQYVQIRSTSTRNNALALITSGSTTAFTDPSLDYAVYEYESDQTTLIGTYLSEGGGGWLVNNTAADFIKFGEAGVQADTGWALVTIVVTITGSASVSLFEVQLVEPLPVLLLPDLGDPTNAPASLNYGNGLLEIQADSISFPTGAFGAVTSETTFGGSSTNGSAATASHSDHGHGNPQTTAGPDADITVGAAGAAGTASTGARSGHGHKITLSASTPAAVATSGSAGTSTTAPLPGNHVHAHETGHTAHDTIWAAKGDLPVGTANDTAAILTVGTDGYTLVADSTQTTGLAWAPALDEGLSVKGSCRLATTAALPANTYLAGVLTAVVPGTLTVDGSTVALNDRVLVKDEAAGANNGIYLCTTAGAVGVAYVLTRSSDMNSAAEVPGAFTFIEAGTVNAGAGFVVASAGPFVLGTTVITWTQFSGAGEISVGSGLTKSGNTLDRAALTGDVTASAGSNATTLAAGSASNLNSGTLAAARMPAHTGDVTSSAGSVALTLAAGSASNLNSGTLAAARLPALTGDVTSSAGSAATTLAAGSASNLNSGTLGAARMPALTGDVTTSAGAVATTIAAKAVTLAKMDDLAQDQFIVRTTASTGVPQTATVTAAARTVLDDTTVGAMVDTLGGAAATGTGGLMRLAGPTSTGVLSVGSIVTTSTIDLGSATATTLSGSAGVLSVEGTAVSVVGHGAADHADITRTFWLAAADAKLDSGTAATLGTVPDALAVVAFADAATQGCYWSVNLPVDWTSGTLSLRPVWVPGSTDASSHAVRWTVTAKLNVTASDVTAAGTAVSATGSSGARTVNLMFNGEGLIDTTLTPAAAADIFQINLRRIGANAADTYVGVVNLLGVRVFYTANS